MVLSRLHNSNMREDTGLEEKGVVSWELSFAAFKPQPLPLQLIPVRVLMNLFLESGVSSYTES